MKLTVMRTWVRNLRNPGTGQTTGRLTWIRHEAKGKPIGALTRDDLEHCCLGVLSWQAYKAGRCPARISCDGTQIEYGDKFETGLLCAEVREYAGMRPDMNRDESYDPMSTRPTGDALENWHEDHDEPPGPDDIALMGHATYASLNDDHGLSLAEIAGQVTRDWKTL
jgi:hypothetical protein